LCVTDFLLRGTDVIDISDLISPDVSTWPRTFVIRAIAEFGRLRATIEARRASASGVALSDVTLKAPLVHPSKIVAAPVNYGAHIREAHNWEWMKGRVRTIEEDGLFLKAPSSILGPGGTIELPYADRRIDHEIELGFVIGKSAHCVAEADAMSHVFGYTCVMDITVRRNAYGRQLDSFNCSTLIPEFGEKEIPLVFIRAPWIEKTGEKARTVCVYDDHIIAARQENMLVTSFHPELTEDLSVHKYFANICGNR
jgi:2-keto-4-pentenoate hydratase/2-oxohepta-3-ene-1,7-dioic acid hydratase in catechol pathway